MKHPKRAGEEKQQSKKTGEENSEPTKGELAVLQVLWQHGPSTVRFVHDTLNEGKESTQYTSTLKLMQLMAEKGMLERDETNMKHVYSPLLEEVGTKGHLLSKFIDTMYQGSVENMIIALLGNEKTSREDLLKMKELLAEMEKKPQ
ncbi:MAG TPA: BlaI/MecI/CopY family transcriptional regulator [Puia sp.]|nr:BlaI/MecI/CopY family transcriptional regulator [Puia sp.]